MQMCQRKRERASEEYAKRDTERGLNTKREREREREREK